MVLSKVGFVLSEAGRYFQLTFSFLDDLQGFWRQPALATCDVGSVNVAGFSSDQLFPSSNMALHSGTSP